MRHLMPVFFMLLALSGIAQARTITDHAGHVVEVPDAPQRIISLHDWTLTLMAHELGAPLIGSAGRMASDGSFYIRGGQELFDLDFTGVEMASVHSKPDLERIRALKPDMIVGNLGDYGSLQPQLATIAPTLMFNPENGRSMLELYEEFASWIGKSDRFAELLDGYQKTLAPVHERLAARDGEAPTYAVILVNGRDGTIQVMKEYGALTTVLDDLGLQRMPIVNDMAADVARMTIGGELIDQIDADYIVTSYLPDADETPESFRTDIDLIAPGAKDFLKAFVNGRVLSLSRYEVYPPTFKGLEVTLKAIETGLMGK